MAADVLDRLLTTLAVRLHAFSVCQIERGWRLLFDPFEAITIHYVLAGTGSVRVGSGPWLPFGPRSIIIVPARQPHALGEPVEAVGEARGEDNCALVDGLVAFTAGDGSRDTLLVCGAITASYGGALGLFDHLRAPLVEDLSSSESFRRAFDLMVAEIAEPSVGTRAMTEALMKQCLILVLRGHLLNEPTASPLFGALHDPRLARAVTEVIESPAAPHTVEGLASLAGMSRASFAERFSEVFSQTPMEFVQRVRLRTAAHLLTTTDLPVKVVTTSVGYTSRSSFSRAFRAIYGTDPKTFRLVGGEGEEQEPVPVEKETGPATSG
jgi:AraC-like DNA-binding protein